MIPCPETHPEFGRCSAIVEGHGQYHLNSNGRWNNEAWVDISRRSVAPGEHLRLMNEAAAKIPPEYRVGRVTVGVADRHEKTERAFASVEPEFLAAALVGARELARTREYMSADDLWDWLEANDHRTAHPKAMTGILRRIISLRYIRPVPRGASVPMYVVPRRSNESRMLRNYECLLQSAPPKLQDFG